MVTPGRKTAKRPTASNRAKTVRKPQSPAVQSAQSQPRKPKPGQRRAEKSKSETARLKNLLRAAEDRQTATAEILKVIASSPSDVQPVFEAIVRSAAKLFEPCSATITTLKDDKLHWNATAASIHGFDVDRVTSNRIQGAFRLAGAGSRTIAEEEAYIAITVRTGRATYSQATRRSQKFYCRIIDFAARKIDRSHI